MSKQKEITKHNINSFLAFDVEDFEALAELALDLHFSWNHSADEINFYSTPVLTERPTEDYTPRIIPYFSGVNVPLEISQILWQK